MIDFYHSGLADEDTSRGSPVYRTFNVCHLQPTDRLPATTVHPLFTLISALRPRHAPPPTTAPTRFGLSFSLLPLLPTTLTIRKRKIPCPLIRARLLAHPALVPSKHHHPKSKAEQCTRQRNPSSKAKVPATRRQLRVEVEGRAGMISSCRHYSWRGIRGCCLIGVFCRWGAGGQDASQGQDCCG